MSENAERSARVASCRAASEGIPRLSAALTHRPADRTARHGSSGGRELPEPMAAEGEFSHAEVCEGTVHE